MAALIFLLLLLTFLSAYFLSEKWTGWLFVACLLAVGLLFWHHMTSGLNINL